MPDSVRPHRRQPTRLPHPWDSPGKNTGVGCHFLLVRNLPQHNKDHIKQILNKYHSQWWNTESISSKIRNIKNVHSNQYYQQSFVSLTYGSQRREEIKKEIQIGKEVKLSLFADDMWLLIQSFMSDFLPPHGLSMTDFPVLRHHRDSSNSSPLSQWCLPTISSSIVHFSPCFQSFQESGSFPMSQFFTSGAKILKLQHQSFQWIFKTAFL